MGGAKGPAHCSFVGFTALRSFPETETHLKTLVLFYPFSRSFFAPPPPFFSRSSSLLRIPLLAPLSVPFFSLLEPFPVSLCLLLYLPLPPFLAPLSGSSSLSLPWGGGKDQAQPRILLRISSTIERNLRSVSIRLATALHEWSTVEWSRPAICAPMCCKE